MARGLILSSPTRTAISLVAASFSKIPLKSFKLSLCANLVHQSLPLSCCYCVSSFSFRMLNRLVQLQRIFFQAHRHGWNQTSPAYWVHTGIRCEVAHLDWRSGRPKQGHLQKAAREMRCQIFQKVCARQQIVVLLIAHHADDQACLSSPRFSLHI